MNLFPERPQPPLAGLPCGAVREGGGKEATRCRGRDPGLRAPSPVPPRWPSLCPAVEWAQGPRPRGSRGGVEAITWDLALHPLPPTPTSFPGFWHSTAQSSILLPTPQAAPGPGVGSPSPTEGRALRGQHSDEEEGRGRLCQPARPVCLLGVYRTQESRPQPKSLLPHRYPPLHRPGCQRQ